MKSPPIIKLTFNDTTFLSLRKRKDAISTIILKHVQYKRVNIPKTHNKKWVDRGGYCMGLVIILHLSLC